MSRRCDFCGKEEFLPFQCPFCGKYFCLEHRLPENHSCANAPERTPLGHWQAKVRKPKPTQSRLAMKKTAISLEPNCPKCGSERTMLTTMRTQYNAFECLKCHHKWTHWKSEQKLKKDKKGFGIFKKKK